MIPDKVNVNRESRNLSIGQATKNLMTVVEVSGILGVSPAWVRDHATRKQPRLKHVKVGKLLRFRSEDVEGFIETWCQ